MERRTATRTNASDRRESGEELLAGLDANERTALIALLRKWLSALEAERGPRTVYGLAIVSKRIALKRRRAVGLPDVAGLMVDDVVVGGTAQQAGIQRGDVITAVDGIAVDSVGALRKALSGKAAPTRLSIVRGATEITVVLQRALVERRRGPLPENAAR